MRSITLVCEDSFDGIMTAVYDGWIRMNQGYTIHILPGTLYEYSFLTEYIYVQTDLCKAVKVSESIRRKISPDAYMMVYRACMHYSEERADAVVEFLKIGYRIGAGVTKNLGNPAVMKVMEFSRKVGNEAHLYKGFIRFRELKEKILFSRISPKCDVLPFVSHHFQSRFPMENWIIYDDTRKKASVHRQKEDYFMVSGVELEEKINRMEYTDGYRDLWKVFFDTIEIESRANERCQRNNIPKWYRKHMEEFDS